MKTITSRLSKAEAEVTAKTEAQKRWHWVVIEPGEPEPDFGDDHAVVWRIVDPDHAKGREVRP